MRTLIISIFALLTHLAAAADASESPVRTVIIIGVDGLSPRGVDEGLTPNMNRLIAQGAYSFHARGVFPTSSSPNWASMIMGAGPEQHGITSNDWRLWSRAIMPSKEGVQGRFPSMFSEVRRHRPDARIAVVYDWGGFGNLFDHDIVDVAADTQGPEATMHRAVEEFKYNRPDLLFIHLDHVDGAGHGKGWHTPEYFEAVKRADDRIGEMIEAIDAERAWSSTVVILTSDHGGVGKSHGGESMDELEIPWIIAGAGIANSREITRDINTYDTACTAAYLLGVPMHSSWVGKPVTEAFTSAANGEWVDSKYLPAPRITPPGALIAADELIVQLSCEMTNADITYTLDGSEPTKRSQVYAGPIVIEETTTIRARAFMRGRESRITSDTYRLLRSDSPKPVRYEYFEAPAGQAPWEALPDFSRLKPKAQGMCPEIGLATINVREDQFAIRYTTQLKVDQPGTYMLHLKSDDGSRLKLGRRTIINNDGSHGPLEESASIDLKPGLHTIVVEYFEDHGGESLQLAITGPDKIRLPLTFEHLAAPE
ncbi:MAG: alkaline phosphatase family protein [Phycisphaerales bacterium JB052]